MQCRRCLSESEYLFRVHTDQLDTTVCALCANEARRLGLPVEALTGEVSFPLHQDYSCQNSAKSSRKRLKVQRGERTRRLELMARRGLPRGRTLFTG